MKYSRFEELPVWKDAIELAVRIFKLTELLVFRRHRSVRDQIERSSMSISNNIAEGFERGTTQETLTFLYIARGSSGETRSVLCLCERLPGLTDLKSEISDLKRWPRESRANFVPGATHCKTLTSEVNDILRTSPEAKLKKLGSAKSS
jgi:four helix bundle protein